MKKIWIVSSLSIIFVLTPALNAKKYKDDGLSGSLNFLYNDTAYKTDGGDYSQKKLTQELKLNYSGNVYSPRLIDYSLDGTLRFEKQLNIFQNNESTSNIQSKDYEAKFNFIKETKAPFSIYAQKSNRPMSTSYSNEEYVTNSIVENRGINGYINLSSINIAYSASQDKSFTEAITSDQETNSKKYNISVTKSEKDYSLKVGYLKSNQDIKHTYLDNAQQELRSDTTTDSGTVFYRLKISDSLNAAASVNYLDSGYLSTQSIGLNANLRWMDKDKYNASFSVTDNIMKSYIIDVNSTDANAKISDTSQNVIVSQAFGYKVSDSITLAQNMAYNSYNSDKLDGETTSLSLGGSYNTSFNESTMFSASLTGMGSKSKLVRDEITDVNETINLGNDFNSLTAASTLTNVFDSINSKMSTTVNYNGSRGDGKQMDGYGVNLAVSSTFLYIFSNNFNIGYFNQKYSYLSTYGDVTTDVSSISVDDNLNFTLRIGIRGKVSTQLGIRYSEINNNNSIIKRTQPKADIGISYRFWQRLLSVTTLHVDNDISYDIMNYSAATSLTYKIGKTFMSAGYQYSKTESQNVDVFSVNREKSLVEAKLVRKF